MYPAVWTGLYAEFPLHEALKTLYDQGWRSFEISTEHLVALDGDEYAAIDSILFAVDELDIKLPQAHAYLQADVAADDASERDQDIDTLVRHLSLAAKLGVSVAVIHPGGKNTDATGADSGAVRARNVEAFRRLAEHAASLGMRIGIENLMRTGASRPEELIELVQDIGNEAVGIVLDTSHANVCELDIPDTIRKFGPRIIGTHISDNDGSGDQHRTPGNGLIDWPPVAAALGEIGYAGPFNLEIPGERHGNHELRALKSLHAMDVATWLVGRFSSGETGG